MFGFNPGVEMGGGGSLPAMQEQSMKRPIRPVMGPPMGGGMGDAPPVRGMFGGDMMAGGRPAPAPGMSDPGMLGDREALMQRIQGIRGGGGLDAPMRRPMQPMPYKGMVPRGMPGGPIQPGPGIGTDREMLSVPEVMPERPFKNRNPTQGPNQGNKRQLRRNPQPRGGRR